MRSGDVEVIVADKVSNCQIWRWIGLENAQAVLAELALRNDISREWVTSGGIPDYNGAAQDVLRASREQFAEIALAHQGRRHRPLRAIGKPVFHPLLSPIPEKLVLFCIQLVRNVQRPADVISVL